MPQVRIGLYQSSSGQVPLQKWLSKLSLMEQAACQVLLEKLQRDGPHAGRVKSKAVRGFPGLFELKGAVRGVQLRIFYCFLPEGVAVLLDGARKTSPGKQDQAILRASTYLRQVQTVPGSWILLEEDEEEST